MPEFTELLEFVESLLPRNEEGNFIVGEEKSDVVHDILAYLAERMIEMNREKNDEISRFLKWFTRRIKTDIDDLKNKTKVREYYKHDLDVLIGVLEQNMKILKENRILYSNRDLQEDIEREFDNSMAVLSPLFERIQATDDLIDQMVYRLYGLTDEEIGIVEGSAGP